MGTHTFIIFAAVLYLERGIEPAGLCVGTVILLIDHAQPQQVGELFESFTLLWQEARTCIDTIEFSKAIVWKDLVPEGFEDTATEIMSKVGRPLNVPN